MHYTIYAKHELVKCSSLAPKGNVLVHSNWMKMIDSNVTP